MSGWNQGYVAELNYVHGFYPELTPALLSLVALSRGLRGPRADGPLTYCDLGCGQGFATNLLAAANPHIEFHGADFNPTQIAGARALAAEAGSTNVHFSDASFQDYADAPGLPDFDIIALHGIYSWVGPDSRAALVEFIRRRLKVGGLVYISFNTLPGWAAGAPLRRLLTEHAAQSSGALRGRIAKSLQFADRLRAAGAAFFAQTPQAGSRLDEIKSQLVEYVSHEYFNRDWEPHYFADVARDLAEAKLAYAGSTELLDHVDWLSFSPAQRAVLDEAAGPVFRETLRDFVTQQIFRRDVFIRGGAPLPLRQHLDAWAQLRLMLTVDRAEAKLSADSANGPQGLNPAFYEPVLDGLADGPRTLGQLRADPRIAAFAPGVLEEVATVLIGSKQAQVCLPAEGEERRAERTRAFNDAVVRRAESSGELLFLASPVTGGGLQVGRFDQLLLRAAQAGDPDPPAAVWRLMLENRELLIRDGQTLESADDNLAELRRFHDKAMSNLPLLQALGIAQAP